jgi:hypothetical protein
MKLLLKFVCCVVIPWLLTGGFVQAQGCKDIDKYKLAKVMGIDKELIPFVTLEFPNCSNILLADGYASFVLNEQNEKINNGTRSEISIDYPFVEGDTVEYRWSIMIPAKEAPGDNVHQWWSIAQWHDQPNRKLGETWASYKGQSPPVFIYAKSRNGTVGIGLEDTLGKNISWAPVPTDVWLDLRVLVHWSTSSNGSVIFSVDNHPEFDFASNGRNMLNSYQHYFKAGQYRDPTIHKYSVINIKNVRFRKM